MKSKKYWGYKATKRIGKRVRNKIPVLPKKKDDNIIVSLIYKPLEFLIKGLCQIGAFCLAGLFYEKGKDSPTKGSLLNTLFYILLAILFVKFLAEI